jgi:beta-carotene ketolase (CrtW type)
VPDDARHDLDRAWPGLALAATIVAAWSAVHVAGVYAWQPARHGWLAAVLLVALQTWLSTGLFILAHDCMHGSLVPGRPRANRRLGTLLVTLYAGFRYADLKRSHAEHHRWPGSERDPDFDPRETASFVGWFARFFRRHYRHRQLLVIGSLLAISILAFDAEPARLAAFWALPAMLSAVQLFAFGTYLPHRPAATAFADEHRARSSEMPQWASLLSCYHFGAFHHEHHLHPSVPWWRLPRLAARVRPAAG